MRGGFGPVSRESFARVGPEPYSWRMFLDLFSAEDSPMFYGTWPLSGSMRNGECFPASNWEPPTIDDAYSCWPTPLAKDHCPGNPIGARNSPSLRDICELWPTPTTQNQTKDFNRTDSLSLRQLIDQVFGHQARIQLGGPGSTRGRPNPEFLEWLMGFPGQWSAASMEPECEPWATQLAHLLPQWLGKY